MEHRIGSFVTSDDLTLFTQQWWPDRDAWTDPKAAFVISHGFGEHSGRYLPFATFLTLHGYAVFTFDHRGHGRSEGATATLDAFGWPVDDLRRYLELLRERHPELSRFLFGQSFGSVVAGHLGLAHPHKVEGLVLSSPFLRDHPDAAPAWLRAISRPMARLLPNLRAVAIDPEVLSRDPAEVHAYKNDPLNFHGRLTARTAVELLVGGEELIERAAALTPPLLLLHGDADRLADPDATSALYRAAGARDKRLELVEGGYHELLNDHDRERVMAIILDWIEERVARSAAARTSLAE